MRTAPARIALIAIAVAVAALAPAGCRTLPAPSATETALAHARTLLDAKRYDDATQAYLTVAHRTVTGPAFDSALAGVAESVTSRIETLPITRRVAALARFYSDTPATLRPPALANTATAWLRSTAEDQLAWARLVRADRARWLADYAAHGSADYREVYSDGVGLDDVRLLSAAECRGIAAAAPRLDQPAEAAALYRDLAGIADAVDAERRVGSELELRQAPTASQAAAVERANGVLTSLLPAAQESLAALR